MSTLHIVIPVYNERGTLEPCIRRVLSTPLPDDWRRQIVLIDDCSDDEHFPAVDNLVNQLKSEGHPLEFHRHKVNQGKGAALQTGFDCILASRNQDDDLVIIQDADLEYDPSDYSKLMEPILSQRAESVIGTRWGSHYEYKSLKHRIHAWGNSFLTVVSNLMTGIRVSDMECCYKVMPVSVLRRVRPFLSEKRFGIEPQMVAAFSKLGIRLEEVPIHYEPRGPSSGKKIGWKDAIRAIIVIMREKFRRGPQDTLHVITKTSFDAGVDN